MTQAAHMAKNTPIRYMVNITEACLAAGKKAGMIRA